jgi:hypothetical protein
VVIKMAERKAPLLGPESDIPESEGEQATVAPIPMKEVVDSSTIRSLLSDVLFPDTSADVATPGSTRGDR